eukprot:contig_20156_g4958
MEGGGRFSSCGPCSNPALYVRIGTLVSGALLIGSAVFRIIRLFVGAFDDPEFFVLLIWVAVFGVLLILAELEWPSCMASQFGFLMGVKGRGFFTFFAGTLALSMGFSNTSSVSGILLIVAGVIACGVSALLFFCGPSINSGGGDVEAPTARPPTGKSAHAVSQGYTGRAGALESGRKKSVSQGAELTSEPPLRGGAKQAKEKSQTDAASQEKIRYVESSTRVWNNQDQHTNITHQIGMTHSPRPLLTLRGRKVETGHPISSRHLCSSPHFHPPNTPGAPSPAWSQPGWALPQHPKDRSQPVHQSPPAPDCPILPEAPR